MVDWCSVSGVKESRDGGAWMVVGSCILLGDEALGASIYISPLNLDKEEED